MTEVGAKPIVKRRTVAELKAWHMAQVKVLEQRGVVRLKKALEKMAADLQALALSAPEKALAGSIGQAATLLSQAAASIKPPQ
jgi:hypothetical protein